MDNFGINKKAAVKPVSGGLLHGTWQVEDGHHSFIVQKLHTVVSKKTCQDAKHITDHARARGVSVPEFVVGADGSQWFSFEGALWRCMKKLPGVCISTVSSPQQAHSAAALLARFHVAAKESAYVCCGSIEHFHDSPFIYEQFKDVVSAEEHAMSRKAVDKEVQIILDAMPSEMLPGDLPQQIIHGDPKISNFLFQGDKALSLLDFDTCLSHSPLVDIGDAMRSWCNPAGEDTANTEFDENIYHAALQGYLSEAALSTKEQQLIGRASRLITLELASRFLRDYFEDRYFGWDEKRFTSRAEHNLLRARGQIALYQKMKLAKL